jgi:hypothetical protein
MGVSHSEDTEEVRNLVETPAKRWWSAFAIKGVGGTLPSSSGIAGSRFFPVRAQYPESDVATIGSDWQRAAFVHARGLLASKILTGRVS